MHTLRYELFDGHIIAWEGSVTYLIDTGAPLSVGEDRSLIFADRTFEVQNNYMGVTPQELSRHVGTGIQALVGADILSNFNLVIDPRSSEILLSDGEITLSGIELEVDYYMGIPIIQAEVNDQAIRMFFDTGAKLSYLNPEITLNYPTLGTVQDFYLGTGSFNTRIFRVPIKLSTAEVDLTVGVLPDLLQLTLMMADTSGILGTGILADFAVELDPHRRRLVLERFDRNASGSFPGLPRFS
jgi:hypothetical protein